MVTEGRRSSAWLKLNRAAWHLRVLDEEMIRFFSQDPTPVVPDNRGDEVGLRLRLPLPEEWALVVGDCLQNLRAALEHIAVEMALDHSPQHNPRRVSFPIADTEEAWSGRNGAQRHVAMMSPAAKAEIERMQPFKVSPGRVYKNVLWLIHELARVDRHQTVHLFVEVHAGDFTVFEQVVRRGNVAGPNPAGARFITEPISLQDVVIGPGVVMVDSVGRRVPTTPYRHIVFDVGFSLPGTNRTFLVSESLQVAVQHLELDVLPPLEKLLS